MRIAKNGKSINLVGQPYRADEQKTIAAVRVEGGQGRQGGERDGAGEDASHQQRRHRQKPIHSRRRSVPVVEACMVPFP